MDPAITPAYAAIIARDWEALRPLLHPYLRWSGSDGTVLRGRNNVMAMLSRTAAPAEPTSFELRDGQIYTWQN